MVHLVHALESRSKARVNNRQRDGEEQRQNLVREPLTEIVRRDEQAYLFHEDAREEVLCHELEASEITVFLNDLQEHYHLAQMHEKRYPGLFQRSQNTELTAYSHERQVNAEREEEEKEE